MKEKYIGIFDSGFGGMTVVRRLKELRPKQNIIYFGDTSHVPYGDKTRDMIISYVLNDIAFLKTFDIDTIGFACNTADSLVLNEAMRTYPDIRFFGIIGPSCTQAIKISQNKRIGVIATSAAINSGVFENTLLNLDKNLAVFSKACPLLVPLVEEGRISSKDPVLMAALKDYLLPLKEKGIDTLILGCTHYPLLKDAISLIIPDIKLVSSSDMAAENIANNLGDYEGSGILHCYVSGDKDRFENIGNSFMNHEINFSVEHVDI